MAGRILLRGGCVLTLDSKVGNFRQGDVLVEDGRIAEVGEGLRARDAELIDAANTIVMPGFVDTHRHAWESLFRNFGAGSSGEATTSQPGVVAADYGIHYKPEDVYAGTLIGLLGAVEAGVTSVVDWSDIQLDETYTDAALQAHADAGLRTVFVHSVPDWATTQETAGSALRRLVAGRSAPASEPIGQSPQIAFGPADPVRADLEGDRRERLLGEWALARELGLRIHAHAGSDESSRGVVSDLTGKGLLGADVTLVHCTNMDDEDLDAISSSRASVSIAPSSEMAGGRRIAHDPEADRPRHPARVGRRLRARRPRRHVRPDAGSHLDAARHPLRSQAGRQSRSSPVVEHPRGDALRHHRRRPGGGPGRLDRIAGARQAGRHRGPPHRSAQHISHQRSDRGSGLGDGYIQRRLGVRRREGPDAQRGPGSRC